MMSKDYTVNRINVRFSDNEFRKVQIVADRLFEGNMHDALRFMINSIDFTALPAGVRIEYDQRIIEDLTNA